MMAAIVGEAGLGDGRSPRARLRRRGSSASSIAQGRARRTIAETIAIGWRLLESAAARRSRTHRRRAPGRIAGRSRAVTARAAPTRAELLRARRLLDARRRTASRCCAASARRWCARSCRSRGRPPRRAARSPRPPPRRIAPSSMRSPIRGAADVAATGWPARTLEVDLDARARVGRRRAAVARRCRRSSATSPRARPPRRRPGPRCSRRPTASRRSSHSCSTRSPARPASARSAKRWPARRVSSTRSSSGSRPSSPRGSPSTTRALDERDREDQSRLRHLRGTAR